MTRHTTALIAGIVLLPGLVACANTPDTDPVRVEQDYGRSVKQMIEGQIYDPATAQRPSAEAPTGLDGVQGEAVLKKHREHIGDPKSVEEDVRIDVTPEN